MSVILDTFNLPIQNAQSQLLLSTTQQSTLPQVAILPLTTPQLGIPVTTQRPTNQSLAPSTMSQLVVLTYQHLSARWVESTTQKVSQEPSLDAQPLR